MTDQDKAMKYRDPKTGEVFDNIRNAYGTFNCEGVDCGECVLGMARCNGGWVETHPGAAARLMGLEVITDKEEPMEKKDKPRICEVLGVEVEQRFTVDGYCPTVKAFWITADGLFETDPPKFPGTSCAMMVAINHPDRIIRLPRFTQEDTADAAAILRWYPTASVASRGAAGHLIVGDKERVVLVVVRPEVHVLPSLRPGQDVRLEDVLEGEA